MIYFKDIARDPKERRPAWTYRGARRNADRKHSRAARAKLLRLTLGVTRREFDRLREFQRQADAVDSRHSGVTDAT